MADHELALDPVLAHAMAECLRALRWESRLSQAEVAKRAGMNRNHYQLLGSGLSDRARQSPSNPRLATLVAVCDGYGTKVPERIADTFRIAKAARATASAE